MLDTVQGERVIVREDVGETGVGKARNVKKELLEAGEKRRGNRPVGTV